MHEKSIWYSKKSNGKQLRKKNKGKRLLFVTRRTFVKKVIINSASKSQDETKPIQICNLAWGGEVSSRIHITIKIIRLPLTIGQLTSSPISIVFLV